MPTVGPAPRAPASPAGRGRGLRCDPGRAALQTERGFHRRPGQGLPHASIVSVAHNRSVTLAVRPKEMLALALSVRTPNPVVTFKRDCLEARSLKHGVGAVASARVLKPLPC